MTPENVGPDQTHGAEMGEMGTEQKMDVWKRVR